MTFQIDIRKIGYAITHEPFNIIKLFNLYRYKEFFETMESHSVKYMLFYLLVIGLFTLTGYYLNISEYAASTCGSSDALKSALMYYFMFTFVPIITGYCFHLFGKGLVDSEISKEEGVSLMTYVATPLIVSGIFRIMANAHPKTVPGLLSFLPLLMFLHYACMAYSIYLLYAAIRVRYGFEKSLAAFMFLMIIVFIASMIIISLSRTILWFPDYCF